MPRQCELYRHFDKDGLLLYVGISLSSVSRLSEHRSDSRWFDKIVKIEIERFPSRRAALDAEAKAIVEEKPIFNIARDGKTCWSEEYERDRQELIAEAKRRGLRVNPRWSIESIRLNCNLPDLSYLPKSITTAGTTSV